MPEIFSRIIHTVIETVFTLGYPGIVGLMFIESSFIPFPSELIMPPAGYLAATGRMNVYAVVACGLLGSLLGAVFNYYFAVWLGEPFLRRFGKYFFVSAKNLDRAEAFFRRHGEISTFVGRLTPVVRQLISVPAGLARMGMAKFLAFTALGAGIWCAILTYVGWLLGRHGASLAEVADQAKAQASEIVVFYILPGLVVLVLAYVYWYNRRRMRSREA